MFNILHTVMSVIIWPSKMFIINIIMLLPTETIKVSLWLFLDFYIAYSKSYSSLNVKVALFG
jgi:hypothetical protein